MKIIALLFIIFFNAFGYSQETEEGVVKKSVDDFFIGFHQRNRVKMEDAAMKDVIMQTIAKDKDGKTVVKTESYDDFLSSILAIPKDAFYEKKLLNLNIQIDNDIAHVWAPYEFWFNHEFSHCGVNSIQLVKIEADWKIVYLIDTRREENCIEE